MVQTQMEEGKKNNHHSKSDYCCHHRPSSPFATNDVYMKKWVSVYIYDNFHEKWRNLTCEVVNIKFKNILSYFFLFNDG
jgi:hypothetical protein